MTDLFHCPQCGGPADNGFSREIPPAPYFCTECMEKESSPHASEPALDDGRSSAPSGVFYQRGFLLPNPYLLIGAAAVAGLIAIGAYFKGRESGLEKYHEYRTEVEAASAKADAANQAKLDEALRNTGDVAALYSRFYTELADGNRGSRLNGVLPARCDRAAKSANAETARLVAASTSDTRSFEAAPDTDGFVSACRKLEADCSITTLMQVQLADWTKKVCK